AGDRTAGGLGAIRRTSYQLLCGRPVPAAVRTARMYSQGDQGGTYILGKGDHPAPRDASPGRQSAAAAVFAALLRPGEDGCLADPADRVGGHRTADEGGGLQTAFLPARLGALRLGQAGHLAPGAGWGGAGLGAERL